ncbi:MAG: hypothetical protein IJS81_08695 [Selenomonadaceae bacterium]|nr:hypothetical protein [Selenomonadaceae bacterium]MBQ7630272.1 hypothetical protein [Selenomonadaceae bacterium]
MKRIRWTIEEVVAIVDVYFRNECGEINNLNLELENLSQSLNRRADILKISHDEKFRNLNGMKCIFENIKYVATDGEEGLSNASKLHQIVVDMYYNEREKFIEILNDFKQKYS